ncbi:MAG TPA: hypothetical protein ENN69_01575 [Spirochaetia bacterium]|nr:hypothetical protein [Spirochaetia bacterium]
MKKLLFLLTIIFLVAGCGIFKGDIYVAIHWADNNVANRPDSITHNIPNVPANVLSINAGSYYLTQPGAITFDATYGVTTWPATATLVAKTATLGKEDNYYDIICFPDRSPIIQEVPTF